MVKPLPLCLLLTVCCSLSCRRGVPVSKDTPPGLVRTDDEYLDFNPRWSHDSSRIAYLRRFKDRSVQLCLASGDLQQVRALTAPEAVSPDRPYRAGIANELAPEGPVWSPDDTRLAIPRVEWFTFENGERLPGTGYWQYHLLQKRYTPLVEHPPRYQGGFFYFRSLIWSPDGARIAYLGEGLQGETILYLRTLPDKQKNDDTLSDAPRFDMYADTDFPVWSPGGERLAFRQGVLKAMTASRVESVRIIAPGTSEARTALRLAPKRAVLLTGEKPSTLPFSPLKNAHLDPPYANYAAPRISGLAWSPDGSRLAIRLVPESDTYSAGQLWILEVNHADVLRRASPQDGLNYLTPIWINGSTLGALRGVPGKSRTFEAVSLSVETMTKPRLLCMLPGDDVDWSPDRKRIVCALSGKTSPNASTTMQIYETGL